MRLLFGAAAGILWIWISAIIMAKTGVEMSNDASWVSPAIVVAGAMTGGDDK